jgi:CRISPR/Cas system-associated endonuclease Cas3-HD
VGRNDEEKRLKEEEKMRKKEKRIEEMTDEELEVLEEKQRGEIFRKVDEIEELLEKYVGDKSAVAEAVCGVIIHSSTDSLEEALGNLQLISWMFQKTFSDKIEK